VTRTIEFVGGPRDGEAAPFPGTPPRVVIVAARVRASVLPAGVNPPPHCPRPPVHRYELATWMPHDQRVSSELVYLHAAAP
jgi:hypothetical protein